MSTLRNLTLAFAFVLIATFSIGVSDTQAQTCYVGGGGVTYTCHGELVNYGGGYSVCYGYITQSQDSAGDTCLGGDVGGGGGGGGGGKSTPSVSMSATPSSIESGHSSQLSFSSSNVTECYIDNGVGTVTANTNGTRTISPTSNTTYTISCIYPSGAVSAQATVSVTAAPQPTAAYCSAGPEVAQVNEAIQWSAFHSVGGGSASLAWEEGAAFTTKVCTGGQNGTALNRNCPEDVTDGGTCSVEGQRCRMSAGCDGNEYVDGSGQPNTNTAYGSVIPYTCVASGSPSATYTYAWSGTDGLTGTSQNVSKSYATTGTKSAQVTIAASTGGAAVATCTADVAGPAPTATLTANPSSVVKGSSSTLTWTSTNASSCTLNEGIGSIATGGNRSVSPENTTTYTLVCSAPSSSISGTWQYYDSDISDFACPLTDPNRAYSSVPNCPSNPQGQACSSTGVCKINTINGCNINTQLYQCSGSAISPAQSATASATVTVTPAPSVSCAVNDASVLPGETVTYTATPANGASSPYSWSSNSGSGFGSGSTVNRVFNAEGTYNMNVSAAGGAPQVACPFVTVSACPGARSASIEASAERVARGASVTLNWQASGIYTSCTVSGPGGTINTTSAASCNVPSGSQTVTVNGQSTYTISCDSGAIADSVIVNVIPDFTEF